MDCAPRILVVDDEPKICDLLEVLLSADGYTVVTAGSGAEALVKLAQSQFSLVLSDIKMPGMDGFELARRIKDIDERLPLVIVTGYATLDTAVQALRHGVDDYVTKPFKLAEMRRVISRVLERARLAAENQRLVGELEAANAELRRQEEALTDRVRVTDRDLTRAHLDLQQRVQELETLNEVGRCAVSELDLDKLLGACAVLVAEKLAVTRASIMLRQGGWLVVKACHGPDDLDLVGRRKKVGDGPAGMAAASGEPVLVVDLASDVRFRQYVDRGYSTSSLVCVPIAYKGKNLGVVCVTDKQCGEPFAASDEHLLTTIASQVAPAIENARLYKQLEESTLSTVRALVAGLEAKDSYLSGHSERVTHYALAIGRAMELCEADMTVLERAGQLHDLGKLGISDVILNKPSSLTVEEYNVVKQHPVLGEQIIRPLTFLHDVRPVIRHHHERPDKCGYPDGQGGEEMGVLARVVSVADAFDAMTSPRPYRPAMKTRQATGEIYSLRGKQFDVEVAELFCDHIIHLRPDEMKKYDRAG